MGQSRHRNIALKLALVVLSAAIAAIGVFGWANAANAFPALFTSDWASIDPLWPVYALAAIACLAAQVIAACAVVNFARLAQAPFVWRLLAIAFYSVSVLFAAYSADKGAQVVLQSAHRAAYVARQTERVALTNEIATLTASIETARLQLPSDSANVMAERQRAALAIFEATTAVATARIPEAQRELSERPALPREVPQDWQISLLLFAIFLAWAILEPWGYALAERGREPIPSVATEAIPVHRANHGANVHWLSRGVALLTLGWFSQFATAPAAVGATPEPEAIAPEPISISQWQDAKAVAFAMRDKQYEVVEIAAKVGRDKSTIYRWFRDRDRMLAAEGVSHATG